MYIMLYFSYISIKNYKAKQNTQKPSVGVFSFSKCF